MEIRSDGRDMSAETYFHNLRSLRMNARRLEHLMLPDGSRSALEVGAGIGDLSAFFLDRGCFTPAAAFAAPPHT
jgi:hypothetical protein